MRVAVVGGAGGMGRVAVADLLESTGVAGVRIVERDVEAGARLAADLDPARVEVVPVEPLEAALDGVDAVVNAATHRINVAVMEACLSAGAHYTDLGGLYHAVAGQYALDPAFRERGLTAAISMGSAPGITNMLAAAACERLETVESIELVDAILPGAPPTEDEPYVAPYAPDTLVDEFTEPAPVFLDGAIEMRPAGSGAKTYRFPEGDVECVYTIHSEPATLPRSYAAKGVRTVEWRLGLPPLDVARLRAFVAAGLASRDPVRVDGREVRPRDVLVATLARQQGGPPPPGGIERLRAHVTGTVRGEPARVDAEVVVRAPEGRAVDPGAYATGVAPSIAAQLLVRGEHAGPGVGGPEAILPVARFFEELGRRGMPLVLSESPARNGTA